MSADRGNLYVSWSLVMTKNLLKQKSVLCACRLVVLCNKCIAFLMSLLLLPLLLLQLPILIRRGTVSQHGYYENVPVLLRDTFYTYSIKCSLQSRHILECDP